METNRQKLIDMATGSRSGYWVEVMHTEAGEKCYYLHRPKDGRTYDQAVHAACTWEALQIFADKYLGQPNAASTLAQHDDGRTAKGSLVDVSIATALMKWAVIK